MTGEASVECLVPARGRLPLSELIRDITAPSGDRPYSDQIVERCAALAQRLARTAGGDAEVQALAFWMRRAELLRLRDAYRGLAGDGVVLVPRGVVFHLPPANVDSIFVYSWLLSVLAGNRNVVRLSERRGESSNRILDSLNALLDDAAADGADLRTTVVSYGHDDRVTAAISAVADMRVVWGGDATVAAVRSVPLPPHAAEITFPDRSSLVAIRAAAYCDLDPEGEAAVAERLFNDSYWFDQMACSSPRALVWIGDGPTVSVASGRLLHQLQMVVERRGYRLDTGTAINKMTYRSRAVIDHPVAAVKVSSNELAVLEVDELPTIGADFCGAGTFWQTRYDRLADLIPRIGRRHQTLAHFGFDPDDLADFAVGLNGRGVDRIVPLGEALTFTRYWDGHDLMREFLRGVYVQTGNTMI